MPVPSHVSTSRSRTRRRPATGRGGFTLVELMVTVAVAAIVLALGAPSFLRALARHAILAQAEALQDAVRIGRNEAMKRGGPVLLCRTDPASPGRCAGTGGSWQTWLLFADLGRTGAFAGGDPILRDHVDVSPRVTISSATPAVRFEPTGIARADTGRTVFVLDPATDGARADLALRRQVCVNERGEAAIVGGDAPCP
jgi:type IV fimbrial biogenesis protein FimT